MNDYSSLFTSGLMLLCDSAHARSRQPTPVPADPKGTLPTGLCSFLSLDMAESLRTFTTGSSSPTTSTRSHSRKSSADRYDFTHRLAFNIADHRPRRPRVTPSPAASSSHVAISTRKLALSPASSRRRSLPQPKPAPLAELPLLPNGSHARSCSDPAAASPAVPAFTVESAPAQTISHTIDEIPEQAKSRRHLAPITSSLKLEISSAPTTPCSRFPTTPTSTRAHSMFSPPPTDEISWSNSPLSPSDHWVDAFASILSPTTTESALGLRFISSGPSLSILPEGENVAPIFEDRASAPKRARARRERHSAPSRNPSITANSTRSTGSVSTHHRRVQRNGALARLEGRTQRSEWMSDEEDGVPAINVKPTLPPSVRHQLAPPRGEDQSFSFIDLTDDIASLAARRGTRV
ncbi:hypothetical protein RhiJN_16917 [Ceratobasidium sp. AG-Ba]|nr:hypothetical protein RhiJN_16917 [Ceratobasidium sp. AG-Ba]